MRHRYWKCPECGKRRFERTAYRCDRCGYSVTVGFGAEYNDQIGLNRLAEANPEDVEIRYGKRHLGECLLLTPEEYKAAWDTINAAR